jgi:hypothetical protein
MLTAASKEAVVFFARCRYETYRTHAQNMDAFQALYGKLTTAKVDIAVDDAATFTLRPFVFIDGMLLESCQLCRW